MEDDRAKDEPQEKLGGQVGEPQADRETRQAFEKSRRGTEIFQEADREPPPENFAPSEEPPSGETGGEGEDSSGDDAGNNDSSSS